MAATAKKEVVAAHTPSKLHDDQFIVHMPSAHEPQPYAYPGCTTEEILALESRHVKTSHASKNGQIDHPKSDGRSMIPGQERKASVGRIHMGSRFTCTDTHEFTCMVDMASTRWNITAAKPQQSRRDMLGQDLGEARQIKVSNKSAPHTRSQSPLKPKHGNAKPGLQSASTRDTRLGATSVHDTTTLPRPRPKTKHPPQDHNTVRQ
ncbi:Hypothetical protein R9X50_00235600 [Acrodontium crateriforme]|uniref:Uncharacterized protein n=1 Tax=Acrodontium crateriforme TaxID=150365 RepID=A0AAQ3M2A6_9PEZI|nr:Hypothetical protein R9X50_00235600 [Acrodontium crateriforme]